MVSEGSSCPLPQEAAPTRSRTPLLLVQRSKRERHLLVLSNRRERQPGLCIGCRELGLCRLREKAANKALSQTAAGIEDFKAGLQPEIVESLHNSLGRSMDADAKKRVKQAKAQV